MARAFQSSRGSEMKPIFLRPNHEINWDLFKDIFDPEQINELQRESTQQLQLAYLGAHVQALKELRRDMRDMCCPRHAQQRIDQYIEQAHKVMKGVAGAI